MATSEEWSSENTNSSSASGNLPLSSSSEDWEHRPFFSDEDSLVQLQPAEVFIHSETSLKYGLTIGQTATLQCAEKKLQVKICSRVDDPADLDDDDPLIIFAWDHANLGQFVNDVNQAGGAAPPCNWLTLQPGQITPSTLQKDLLLYLSSKSLSGVVAGHTIGPTTNNEAINILRTLRSIEESPFMQQFLRAGAPLAEVLLEGGKTARATKVDLSPPLPPYTAGFI